MKPCSTTCNCTVFHQETLNKIEQRTEDEKTYLKMVDYLKVIGDPTRIKILDALKEDQLCVCDLSYLIGVTKSAISHQMKLLKSYDLVESNKIGKMVYYTAKGDDIYPLIEQTKHLVKGHTHD